MISARDAKFYSANKILEELDLKIKKQCEANSNNTNISIEGLNEDSKDYICNKLKDLGYNVEMTTKFPDQKRKDEGQVVKINNHLIIRW